MKELREFQAALPIRARADLGRDRNTWPQEYRDFFDAAMQRARDKYFVETRPLSSECKFGTYAGSEQWLLIVTEIEVPQCV